MAQFDVFVRRNGSGFLLECQAASLAGLNTRFVLPLLPRAMAPSLIGQLNPVFEIDEKSVVLMPQNAATVSTRELGTPVTSFEIHRYTIMNALDMLLSGY